MVHIGKDIMFLILVFIQISCNREDCNADLFFDKKFNKSILTMTLSEKGKEISIQEKLDAIRFLEAVTGYKSTLDDIKHPVYKDKKSFLKDKRSWQDWYRKNRCKLSNEQMDSLLIIYKKYNF